MIEIPEVIGLISLIVVGLNLTANNTLVSVLVNYVFYKDKNSGLLLRILGAIMALSSVLIILDFTDYAIYLNIFIIMLLVFTSIRARNRAYAEKMNARDKLLKEYQEELKRKRERVEELKEKALRGEVDEEAPAHGLEGQSVADIKKKMWDDGTMTNKELINGFKDE